MNKKFIGILVAVIVVLGLGGVWLFGNNTNTTASETQTKNDTTTEKILKVGTTAQTYPNSFKEDGKLKGYDIEVTEAIAKELGYKVEWEVIGDVPGNLGALDSGKIDTVANAITVLPSREELYNFSTVTSYYAAQIAVKKDSSYKTLESLKGKTVSATLGSSNITLLEKYDPEIKIRPYEDRNAIFTDANNGTVDGVLNQKQFLQETIKKQNLDLRIVDGVIGWNEAAYPFAKNEKGKALQEEFNKAIDKLSKDGTLSKLSEQYFGEDISKVSTEK